MISRCTTSIICVILISLSIGQMAWAETCTYSTWDWDTVKKKSTHHRRVKKPRHLLTVQEKGDFPGCTVCSEDQVEVKVGNLPHFKICRAIQDRVVRGLEQIVRDRFPVKSIVGYRVGRSKGPINGSGERTEFSNHSFGTALDLNSESNGLYGECFHFSPGCRLLRGGPYNQEAPGAITPQSSAYRAMRNAGLKWGGELKGNQKDFMHFSLTGN